MRNFQILSAVVLLSSCTATVDLDVFAYSIAIPIPTPIHTYLLDLEGGLVLSNDISPVESLPTSSTSIRETAFVH